MHNLQDEEKSIWWGKAKSNITFLNHVNCMLDELPFNISYIIYLYLHNSNFLMILMSNWENIDQERVAKNVQMLHINNKYITAFFIFSPKEGQTPSWFWFFGSSQAKYECKLESDCLLITTASNKHLYCPINTLTCLSVQ